MYHVFVMQKTKNVTKQFSVDDATTHDTSSIKDRIRTKLRNAFHEHAKKYGWTIYIPKFSYTTDNAAMIGITGYYKYLDKDFCPIDRPAFSKVTFQ